MAPATPLKSLPKSKFHSTATPVSVPPLQPTLHAYETAFEETTSFSHPEHIIPPRTYQGLDRLIIVCGHAIFHPDVTLSSFPLHTPYEERNWHLASFQQSNPVSGKPGEHETFVGHLRAGIETLTNGPWAERSILVFSGGITKSSLTSLSEARSYYHAALSLAMAQDQRQGGIVRTMFDKGRILLEESATDSFQNLLLSILLFRRTTGIYPKEIRVITHAFKAKRFLNLHAPAISWPPNQIRVHGIDPVMSQAEYEDTARGEDQLGYSSWQDDSFGTGETLARKRTLRGWDENRVGELCEGLEDSVQHLLLDGKTAEPLPWTLPTHPARKDS
jgi:hypothetical protein